MPAFDALHADQLRADVHPKIIGRDLVVLEETTSTSDCVFKRTLPSTPEGLVVFAESQTAGRGQRGNSWESASGKGLWFSILLRPNLEVGESPRLAEWAARIVAETISSELGLAATVKLPNDVILGRRKVAGVLVEMRAQKKGPHVAIVGIGVNANHCLEDFSKTLRSRATSLAIALNREIHRHQFAVALLRNLDRTYAAAFER